MLKTKLNLPNLSLLALLVAITASRQKSFQLAFFILCLLDLFYKRNILRDPGSPRMFVADKILNKRGTLLEKGNRRFF